jgi:hypothetical protein
MTADDLRALRETFRARMADRDFCIGQEEVEALFRELLGEPEPAAPELDPNAPRYAGGLSLTQIDQVFRETLTPARIQDVLSANSALLGYLRRKR